LKISGRGSIQLAGIQFAFGAAPGVAFGDGIKLNMGLEATTSCGPGEAMCERVGC